MIRKLGYRVVDWVDSLVVLPDDSEMLRARKIGAFMMICGGFINTINWMVWFIIFGVTTGISIEIASALVYLINLFLFTRHKKIRLFMWISGFILMVQMSKSHITFGGFQNSGYILIWIMLLPLMGALFMEFRDAVAATIIMVVMFILAVIFESQFSQVGQVLPEDIVIINAVASMVIVALFGVISILYLIAQLNIARERADNLLMNILPVPIANQLKHTPGTIADTHQEVTVMFADIVDFTKMSSNASSEAVVGMLNDIFSDFDRLTDKHGLEKIKTIGDAYMVAGGLPEPRDDHAEAVVEMGLEMLDVLKNHKALDGGPVNVRIGVNTGSVVAGVIGQQKFIYDLWGDAVNTASRMESNGVGGAIQVTEATKDKLGDKYVFEPREPIFIKGKGEMVTYLLKGRE